MDKIFCMEFQHYALKLNTKHFIRATCTMSDVYFILRWNLKSFNILGAGNHIAYLKWFPDINAVRNSWECFTNISRALQNILSKFVFYRNQASYKNFKLKLYKCAQSMALGTLTKFQLWIPTINVISGIVYYILRDYFG